MVLYLVVTLGATLTPRTMNKMPRISNRETKVMSNSKIATIAINKTKMTKIKVIVMIMIVNKAKVVTKIVTRTMTKIVIKTVIKIWIKITSKSNNVDKIGTISMTFSMMTFTSMLIVEPNVNVMKRNLIFIEAMLASLIGGNVKFHPVKGGNDTFALTNLKFLSLKDIGMFHLDTCRAFN